MSDTRIELGVAQGKENVAQRAAQEIPIQEARLVSVSEDIRQDARDGRTLTRVRGEVVRTRGDGSVSIQTQQGRVDVKLEDGQPLPQKGQRVEVDLRAVRAETPPVAERHAGRQSQNPPPVKLPENVNIRVLPQTPQSAQARANATPIEVQLQPPAPAAPATAQPQAQNGLPTEGTLVRLTPLPPSVAQTLAPPVPAEFIAVQASSIQSPAPLIALEPQSAPVLPIQIAPLAPSIAANIAPIIPQELPPAAARVLTPATVIVNTAAPSAPPILQAPVLVTPSGGASILPPVDLSPRLSAPITPPVEGVFTPVAETPTPIAQPSATPQDLTVRIAAIEPQAAPQIVPASVAASAPVASDLPQAFPVPDAFSGQVETLILQNQKAGNITGVVTNITPAPATSVTTTPQSAPAPSLPIVSVYFPQIGAEQLFALQFPSDAQALNIGTQIQLTPQAVNSTLQSLQTVPLANVPLPLVLAPQMHWPAMEELAQTLARIAPQSAQAMMNVTPSPANPVQLGPAAMFFIAALRGGDLGQWLGDKAQELLRSAGKTNALSKLTGEGRFLSRVAGEPTPQDWRALNIPMLWEGDIQKVALYYRHEREDVQDDEENGGLKGTRFVFDLSLDAMGKVQLDGLFKPREERDGLVGRLDVALRTEQHFAEASRAEMRRIYARALRDTQITGELSFQNNPETWVTIQADDRNALGVNA